MHLRTLFYNQLNVIDFFSNPRETTDRHSKQSQTGPQTQQNSHHHHRLFQTFHAKFRLSTCDDFFVFFDRCINFKFRLFTPHRLFFFKTDEQKRGTKGRAATTKKMVVSKRRERTRAQTTTQKRRGTQRHLTASRTSHDYLRFRSETRGGTWLRPGPHSSLRSSPPARRVTAGREGKVGKAPQRRSFKNFVVCSLCASRSARSSRESAHISSLQPTRGVILRTSIILIVVVGSSSSSGGGIGVKLVLLRCC